MSRRDLERDANDGWSPDPGPEIRRRQVYRDHEHAYLLNDDELRLLREIGTFRTLAAADAERYLYPGRERLLEQDLRTLFRHGLAQQFRVPVTLTRAERRAGREPVLTVLVVSDRSKQLLTATAPEGSRQAYYARPVDRPKYRSRPTREQKQARRAYLVQVRQLKHDTALYAVYRREKEALEARGNQVTRVALDYEFKGRIARRMNRVIQSGASESTVAAERRAAAAENELQVVDGRIPLPDLRLEYETPEGERRHVDLEVLTRHYHRSQRAQKHRAGFRMYDAEPSFARPIWDDHDLTGEILA